jgi:DnaJ-class molecular chaperone
MEQQCPQCKGIGVETDGNGILSDNPCDYCMGTGVIDDEDELLAIESELS